MPQCSNSTDRDVWRRDLTIRTRCTEQFLYKPLRYAHLSQNRSIRSDYLNPCRENRQKIRMRSKSTAPSESSHQLILQIPTSPSDCNQSGRISTNDIWYAGWVYSILNKSSSILSRAKTTYLILECGGKVTRTEYMGEPRPLIFYKLSKVT